MYLLCIRDYGFEKNEKEKKSGKRIPRNLDDQRDGEEKT